MSQSNQESYNVDDNCYLTKSNQKLTIHIKKGINKSEIGIIIFGLCVLLFIMIMLYYFIIKDIGFYEIIYVAIIISVINISIDYKIKIKSRYIKRNYWNLFTIPLLLSLVLVGFYIIIFHTPTSIVGNPYLGVFLIISESIFFIFICNCTIWFIGYHVFNYGIRNIEWEFDTNSESIIFRIDKIKSVKELYYSLDLFDSLEIIDRLMFGGFFSTSSFIVVLEFKNGKNYKIYRINDRNNAQKLCEKINDFLKKNR